MQNVLHLFCFNVFNASVCGYSYLIVCLYVSFAAYSIL